MGGDTKTLCKCFLRIHGKKLHAAFPEDKNPSCTRHGCPFNAPERYAIPGRLPGQGAYTRERKEFEPRINADEHGLGIENQGQK